MGVSRGHKLKMKHPTILWFCHNVEWWKSIFEIWNSTWPNIFDKNHLSWHCKYWLTLLRKGCDDSVYRETWLHLHSIKRHIVGTNEIFSKEWQMSGHMIIFSWKWAFWALQAGRIPKNTVCNFWGCFFHIFMIKKTLQLFSLILWKCISFGKNGLKIS